MSTRFGVFEFGRRPSFAFTVAVAAAATVAWHGSTSGGGHDRGQSERLVAEITRDVPLTPFCRAVAENLLEMSIRRKISDRRPTRKIWIDRENEAAIAYETSGCPIGALVPISAAAASVAIENERHRAAEADQ